MPKVATIDQGFQSSPALEVGEGADIFAPGGQYIERYEAGGMGARSRGHATLERREVDPAVDQHDELTVEDGALGQMVGQGPGDIAKPGGQRPLVAGLQQRPRPAGPEGDTAAS